MVKKITVQQLKDIVTESVKDILDCTDLLSENYIGEDEMIFKYPCTLLSEGLIMSYPIEDVIETLGRCNSLIVGNVMIDILNGKYPDAKGCIYSFNAPNKNTNVIYAIIPKGKYNKQAIDKKMIKYGWICTKEMEYVLSSDYQKLLYERKFDINASEIVYSSQFLYHICPNNKVDKILKQGLLPKENTWQSWDLLDDTMGEDYRVYFFINTPDDAFLNNWKKDFNANKKVASINDGYTLLRVDVSKLKNDLIFYWDPRTKYGIYTREVIPPVAIEKIKEI